MACHPGLNTRNTRVADSLSSGFILSMYMSLPAQYESSKRYLLKLTELQAG